MNTAMTSAATTVLILAAVYCAVELGRFYRYRRARRAAVAAHLQSHPRRTP